MKRIRIKAGTKIAADFLSLFAGRIGGILITLFFIPQYNRILGGEVFGAVAVVLSLQSFFLVSDLGLATLISRDTAIAQENPVLLSSATWMRRRAEAVLAILAIGVTTVASLPFLGVPVRWPASSGLNADLIAILIALLVATNIVQLSLNAIGLYRASAGIAVVGALARGVATVLILRVLPSLSAFLVTQVVLAAAHFLAARWMLERRTRPVMQRERLLDVQALTKLGRRCLPLVLYTLGAAAAVNLDKSIISAFISLRVAGVYFLATTFALVPVGILSGPVNNYFAPRVAHARHADNLVREYRLALTFQTVLMFVVVGPSLSLAFQMSDWLMLWLHDPAQTARIMLIAPILLAGGALSATGYYPTTYLIAAEDNRYLARLSMSAAFSVLGATFFFASRSNLVGVAWSYFAFYAVGFVGLWLRLAIRIGWNVLARFLAVAYLMPAVIIALLYWPLRAVIAKMPVPLPLALLGPVAAASVLGMLICGAIMLWLRDRPGWTGLKEAS